MYLDNNFQFFPDLMTRNNPWFTKISRKMGPNLTLTIQWTDLSGIIRIRKKWSERWRFSLWCLASAWYSVRRPTVRLGAGFSRSRSGIFAVLRSPHYFTTVDFQLPSAKHLQYNNRHCVTVPHITVLQLEQNSQFFASQTQIIAKVRQNTNIWILA